MYQREFDALLQKQLPKAVLLYGKNRLAIERYLEYYIQRLDAKQSAMKLFFDHYDFESAKGYLSQNSLFGGNNLLILKHDKKIAKKDLEHLIALSQKNQESYLVFAFLGEDRQAKELQSVFSPKHGGIWVRFFEPTEKEAIVLLEQYANAWGLTVDRYTLGRLIVAVQNDLEAAVNELKKLALLDRAIVPEDIDTYVYSALPLSSETFLFMLFENKPISQVLAQMLEGGEDPFAIMRATQYFLQQIFLFQAYMKLHGTIDTAQILGYKLPRQIQERHANLAITIKPATLLRIYEHLLYEENRLKEAHTSQKESLLFACMIGLQRLLV